MTIYSHSSAKRVQSITFSLILKHAKIILQRLQDFKQSDTYVIRNSQVSFESVVMNNLSNKIGSWSARLLAFTFVIWIVCFIGIALTSPVFYWTNPEDYFNYSASNSQYFQNIAKFFMLLFGPLYVLFIHGFYDYAADDKKALVRISILFGMGFAVLSSIHYFVQLTAVRLNIEQGNLEGLEHFLQANPYSVMSSINMLGWTLFLGLSSLFIFPVFKGDKRNKLIGFAFLCNGISCVLGGVGYFFHIDLLTFVFMNLGLGGSVLTFSVASIGLFKRLKTT